MKDGDVPVREHRHAGQAGTYPALASKPPPREAAAFYH
nr:MAG TPA: hypothetical protein [Caudoviricetes sp.]DAQ17101.1 MAG TPA: hypothetical protein [Caudoviricetes sp.]